MHGPDGTNYPNRIVFHEITPPSQLEYENGREGGTQTPDRIAVYLSGLR